jgi:CcmD family protein
MAETTNYLIAGYVVFSIGMFGYLLSLVLRARSLKQDLDVLQDMEKKEN